MWSKIEKDNIENIYKDIGDFDVSQLFDKDQWFAITASGGRKNVGRIGNWFYVPPAGKEHGQARFQYVIYDDVNDKDENEQTNRWRDHFKTVIDNLKFHPDVTNVLQIGFSMLAWHPIKHAKKAKDAFIYVRFFFGPN